MDGLKFLVTVGTIALGVWCVTILIKDGQAEAAKQPPMYDAGNYIKKFQTTTVDGAKVTCFESNGRYLSCVKE